ncbi:unnamed protein product, partial [Ectocarpus sp. 6 AP-2014]
SPRPSAPKIEQRPRSSHHSSTQSCSRVCESPILPAGGEGMLASAELLLSRDEAVSRLPGGPAVTFQDKAGVLHHQQWWPLEMLFLAREVGRGALASWQHVKRLQAHLIYLFAEDASLPPDDGGELYMDT